MGDSLGGVAAEAIDGGEGGNLGEADGRDEDIEALEGACKFILGDAGVGFGIFGHAASGRAWGVALDELSSFSLRGGTSAVEGDAVDNGVGVAYGAESVANGDGTAVVDGLTDEENGTAVLGWLAAQEICGVDDAVEDRGMVVAGLEAVEGGGDTVEMGGELLNEGRGAVEADDGNLVSDAAEEGVEHGGEGLVDVEVMASLAAGLYEDDKSEGLRAGILVEVEFLLHAVVGEGELVGRERVNHLSGPGANEGRDDDQCGSGGDGRGWGIRLIRLVLGVDDRCLSGEQKESEQEARPEHHEFSIAAVPLCGG